MGDDLILLALFFFLYVSDSYFLLHKHSVAFREVSRGNCRIIFPGSNAGNRDYAVHMFSLLPPLRSLYVCSLLPVSLSKNGILSYISQTLSESGRPRQSCQEIEYGGIYSVKAEEEILFINDKSFVSCQVSEHATLIAGAVEEIISTNGQESSRIFENIISSTFDVNHVSQVMAEYRRTSRHLRIFCNTVFIVLFILFPALAQWHGLGISLIVTLVLLGVLLPPLCVSFFSLHKRFSIGSKWDRIGCIVRFIICPPCSICANNQISRFLLTKFHPITGSLVLCSKPNTLDLVGKILRDLRYPLRQDVNASLSLLIDEEWRKKLTSAVEQTALKSGVEEKELQEIPKKSDSSILTFCPRCLAQFSAPIDSCPDCLGVNTMLFPFSEDAHE